MYSVSEKHYSGNDRFVLYLHAKENARWENVYASYCQERTYHP